MSTDYAKRLFPKKIPGTLAATSWHDIIMCELEQSVGEVPTYKKGIHTMVTSTISTIEAGNLAANSDEMLRQIGETGQPIDITENGVIVARVIPVYGHSTPNDLGTFWSDWDRMSEEIGEELERQGIESVDAVELMKDVRG